MMIGNLNGLDIHARTGIEFFAGAGGLALGLHIADPDYRTVAYVEREASAAASLVARMEDKALDKAPIADDIKTFDGRPWRGLVDIISGGYPCQGESTAGKRLGNKDPRWLWPDLKRIIGEVEPEICFFENVANHLNMGFFEVATDLQTMGYRIAAGLFSAEETGASHERLRLFIVGHRNGYVYSRGMDKRRIRETAGRSESGNISQGEKSHRERIWPRFGEPSRDMANSEKLRLEIRRDGSGNEAPITKSEHQSPGMGNSEHTERRTGEPIEHVGDREAGERQETPSGFEPPSQKLANPENDDGRCEQQEEGTRGRRGRPTGEHEGVADTSSAGLQGSEQCGPSGERDWSAAYGSITKFCGARLPLFAPGPGDFEAWAKALENSPYLEPAICRVVDGMASELDPTRASIEFEVPTPEQYINSALRYRTDRLRLCGNGVSPLAAAYAYRTLTDALREYAAGQ